MTTSDPGEIDLSDPGSYEPTRSSDPGTVGLLSPPRSTAERERFVRRAVDQCS